MMKIKIFNFSNFFIFLSFLAIWWTISDLITPALHYHLQQSAFLTGADFFNNFSDYPGGISDYLAEFIAQFFKFNLFGSFLIAIIASLQGFIAISIVKRLIGNIKFAYTIFALVLLFGVIVLCNYYYPYYASIRLLFAFIFSWGFCLINTKYQRLSVIVWFFFASLLFYIAGGFAMFIFTLATVLIFLITNKQPTRLLNIPVFLFFAGILPYLGYKLIFQMSLENHYKITLFKPPVMLAYSPEMSLYIYYFLLPAFILAILLFKNLRKNEKSLNKKDNRKTTKISFLKHSSFLIFVQVIVFAVFGYFLFKKSYDPFKKNLLYIEYYAEHEQWKEVLNTAQNIYKYDIAVNFQVNRAYLQLGLLPEHLFDYPQLLGSRGLFVDVTLAKSASMPGSDLYYDLGFMGESQHWAFEAQTLMPNSPRILKRLIMINLVNRKYNLAEKFLDILDKNMLYHDWVMNYERYVSDTTLADNDKIIAEKRLFTSNKESINYGDIESLKLLFETNHNNRKAFDYLISAMILDSQFPEFIKYLQYYKYYNLKKLPRSWEEVLTFYMARTQTHPEYIPLEIVSKNCIKKFTDFTNRIQPYKDNLQAAKSSVTKDYSNTYWYYLLYLHPQVTKVLENNKPVQSTVDKSSGK